MSFPEYELPLMRQAEINVEVEEGTLFFAYCTTCEKVLYCATENTRITRFVAEGIALDHSESFEEEHEAITVLNPHAKIKGW